MINVWGVKQRKGKCLGMWLKLIMWCTITFDVQWWRLSRGDPKVGFAAAFKLVSKPNLCKWQCGTLWLGCKTYSYMSSSTKVNKQLQVKHLHLCRSGEHVIWMHQQYVLIRGLFLKSLVANFLSNLPLRGSKVNRKVFPKTISPTLKALKLLNSIVLGKLRLSDCFPTT
jgi:hypothetical protein